MVLVDSSAWIEALRKTGSVEVKSAVEGLLEEYEAQWCSPIHLEVMGGARKQERRRLGSYFAAIPYCPITETHWQAAVALAWKIRDQGLSVPWLDVLIAATALEEDLRLYAIDNHFSEIARYVPLKLYIPGYGGRYQPEG